MHAIETIFFASWAGTILVWLGLLVAQFRMRRDGLLPAPPKPDHESDPVAERSLPSLCVIVPARNEGESLVPCVGSVLAQDYPSLELLLVDDRSTDDTPKVIARLAARDDRVRAVWIDSLPDGWMGKSHALHVASQQAKADWILFLDADCILDAGAVRAAIGEALRRDADFLSAWPRQTPGTFWEHMLIPLCAAIIALWFGSSRVNRAGSSAAFANGQFLLVRREAYERIGGHESVRLALIEDVPLAEVAKRAGLACRVISGRHLVAVRMYRSYRAIRDGWARIYVGALRSGVKLAASILWLLTGSLLPFVAIPAVWLASLFAGTPGLDSSTFSATAVFSTIHLLLLFIVSYRFWGLGDCRRAYLWLYPVSVIVVITILARAWWWIAIKRSIPWRDNSYRIDRRARIIAQSQDPHRAHAMSPADQPLPNTAPDP